MELQGSYCHISCHGDGGNGWRLSRGTCDGNAAMPCHVRPCQVRSGRKPPWLPLPLPLVVSDHAASLSLSLLSNHLTSSKRRLLDSSTRGPNGCLLCSSQSPVVSYITMIQVQVG